MVLGKLDSDEQRMILDCRLTPHIKTSSEGIEDLNLKPETIKYIEENAGTKLVRTGLEGKGGKSKNK